jgi:hypothetical protein
MGKNSFKGEIRDRYKGRGNCWVKVLPSSTAYPKVIDVLPKSDPQIQTYLSHIEREGFAWIRFSKAEGTESNPVAVFEVRYKGSKIDHPDVLLNLSDSEAKDLPFLGNTPVKLQLEVFPADRKSKEKSVKASNAVRKRKQTTTTTNVVNVDEDDLTIKINEVKETSLGKANPYELKAWEKFLELEGLLDDSI